MVAVTGADLHMVRAFASDPPLLHFTCSGCGTHDASPFNKAGVQHWKRTGAVDSVCGTWEPVVTYRRVSHAAHYAPTHPDRGHDLEQWDYAQPSRLPVPAGVGLGAEWHVGYLNAYGVQHWVYVRRAPLTGETCPRCPAQKST